MHVSFGSMNRMQTLAGSFTEGGLENGGIGEPLIVLQTG